MPSLTDLHRAVETALASGRLGTPVFVRYLLLVPDPPDAVTTRLAQLAATANGWLGQPLAEVYAPAPPQDGAVTVTLRYRTGATALVSIGPGDGAADVLVLGNRGALYHDLTGSGAYEVPQSPAESQLLAVVSRALQSNRPESLP